MSRKPVHLMCIGTRNGVDGIDHNKFYDMFEVNGELHCRYGRVNDTYKFGESGTLKRYPLSSWDKIYAEKRNKGYFEEIAPVQLSKVTDTDSKYAPISNPNIARIVDRLQEYANRTVSANYKMGVAGVTQDMIDKAQSYIDSLTACKDMNEFNNTLIALFRCIPRKMNTVEVYLAHNVSELSGIVKREQDLLDVLRGQLVQPVRGQKLERKDGLKHTILEINGITIEEATQKDIDLVRMKLGKNASRLRNVWRVSNEKQAKAYEKYCTDEGIGKKDCKLLFHGTRSENVWNILKTGLVLRPQNAIITGKMFGHGIYFAPSSQKSLGYTSLQGSYWANGNANSGFMILHAVAYGKPYDVYSFDSKYYNFNYNALRRACPGANCLHAHAGTMLKNDEIIVYKEEQIMPLYLIELG